MNFKYLFTVYLGGVLNIQQLKHIPKRVYVIIVLIIITQTDFSNEILPLNSLLIFSPQQGIQVQYKHKLYYEKQVMLKGD
jgi:hypothetical protein